MRKLKRIGVLVLACIMVMSLLTGCGSSKTTAPEPAKSESQSAEVKPLAKIDKEKAAKGEITAADLGVNITSTDKIKVVWADVGSPNLPTAKAVKQFVQLLSDATNGNLILEYYPGGELGNAQEINQNLRDNLIQFSAGATGSIIDEKLSYFDLRGAAMSKADYLKLTAKGTEVREYTEKVFNDIGFHLVSLTPWTGSAALTTKPINSFADFQKLKFRTAENPVQMDFWKNCGANPIPLAYGELYLSLQQGLVEGAESGFSGFLAMKFYEVAKYAVATNNSFYISGVWMNKEAYDSLPADYRQLIDAAGQVMEYYSSQISDDSEADTIQALKDNGVTFTQFNADDFAKTQEAGKKGWDYIRKISGDEPVDLIIKTLGIK